MNDVEVAGGGLLARREDGRLQRACNLDDELGFRTLEEADATDPPAVDGQCNLALQLR